MRVFILPFLFIVGASNWTLAKNHKTQTDPNDAIEVVKIEEQTWYEAEDRAVAREIASPRNSRAQKLSIADIKLPPGVSVRAHYHEVIEEIYYISAGSGILFIDGKEKRVVKGDAIVIRPGERHSIRNDTEEELRLIVTCTPAWTPDCLIFD